MPNAAATLKKAMNYLNSGMVEAAESMLSDACRKDQKNPDAAHLYGLVLFQNGKPEPGLHHLQRAVKLRPAVAGYHISLANAFSMTHRQAEAVQAYRRALRLDPGNGPAHLGLAFSLVRLLDIHGAIDAGRQALGLMPKNFQAYANLSTALREAGEVDEAINLLRRACERFPNNHEIASLFFTAVNYRASVEPELMVQQAQRFVALVGPPEPINWPNNPDPDRTLRVGYLSADFRTHSVAFFFAPVLKHHNPEVVETFCYSVSPRDDRMTEHLRSLAVHWVEARRLGTNDLAARIRDDHIDILVELGGHTNNNRLSAVAKGCAPVQATYLGYPNTTGVSAIGYRFVDLITDPPGADRHATEELIRIPGCFVCYEPPADAPPPRPPPHRDSDFIVFGSFNSLPKISPDVVDLWVLLLKHIPKSRLMLKNKSFGDPDIRRRYSRMFTERGVDETRIELLGQTPQPVEHLAMYDRIDVALDTFPYNGTTTTCEALWMGVPVVTLEGQLHAGRVGASLLTAAGLPELIAPTSQAYVEIAARLAGDSTRLAERRSSLRSHMAGSELCNGPAFASKLENAYRRLWQTWCARPLGGMVQRKRNETP